MSKMDITVDSDDEHSSSEGTSVAGPSQKVGRGKKVQLTETHVESDFVSLSFPHDEKRKSVKELFSAETKKVKSLALVHLAGAASTIRKVTVGDIGLTRERFCVEAKILALYGTYDTVKECRKYLKADLADEVGFDIVTLVFGPNIYKKFIDGLAVNACIRVEGVDVLPRSPADGGSIDFSLHANATTCITDIPVFETTLFFIPEVSIRTYLDKVATNPVLKATIAFVILQVDNIQKSEGGVHEQLTIADGPNPMDRATLTFVSKRKSLYYQLVDQFHGGSIIPLVARNVGAWKEHANTLSILDMTLVFPLLGEFKKAELIAAFHAQIKSLGYGKQVVGELRITSFNSPLFVKKCGSCKSQNLNVLQSGAFCYSCGQHVSIDEVVRLSGEVSSSSGCTEVILPGEVADRVLQFGQPLSILCKREQALTRIRLSETVIRGVFTLDPHGHIIGYEPNTSTAS